MMKLSVDLNCDMGEGFGHWVLGDAPDEELMKILSSANVATGFHAGDPNSMNTIAKLAKDNNVGLGAHPGYQDLRGFGRRFIQTPSDELINDILYQVGALREFGRRHDVELQHVKPHGMLYMEAARNEELSTMLIDTLQKTCPDQMIFCMGISVTRKIALEKGYPSVREFYADRDYDSTGSIVFAKKVGKMDPKAVAEKCLRACVEGKVATVDGVDIDIEFESICFHSDSPGALVIGQSIHDILKANGITIEAPRKTR
ncbi:5-oxoprolinase subunit PxpA [Alphaproteobacteria bacterium]|jgi:UPF0271 protein|nr:5-oxoprolinase subunit PxpA [Alphaproteobacteria bacterium]